MNLAQVFFVSIVFTSLIGCVKVSSNADVVALDQHQVFNCPKPGLAKFINWGKAGRAKVCEVRIGSFIGAEHGKIIVIGQFSNGVENGVWRWLDREGHSTVLGEFANGIEVGVWRWFDKQGHVIKEVDYAQSAEFGGKQMEQGEKRRKVK